MSHTRRSLSLEVHNGQLRVATPAATPQQECGSSVEGSKTVSMVRRRHFPLLPVYTHDGPALASTRDEDITDEVTVTFATAGLTPPQPPTTEFTTAQSVPFFSQPPPVPPYGYQQQQNWNAYPPPPPPYRDPDDPFAGLFD